MPIPQALAFDVVASPKAAETGLQLKNWKNCGKIASATDVSEVVVLNAGGEDEVIVRD